MSQMVQSMADWYDVMSISYANTIRHHSFSQSIGVYLDLLGANNGKTHLGVMHHIGVAWVVFFNWINALAEVCPYYKPNQFYQLQSTNTSRFELPAKDIPAWDRKVLQGDVEDLWKQRANESLL